MRMPARFTPWPALAVVINLTACAGTPDPSATVSVVGPSYAQFAGGAPNGSGVHVFLENQCGTLDCHGQMGRPFRLYSADGLRDPNEPGLVSGVGTDTSAEIYSNYLSAIGLQPEEMNEVVAGLAPPTDLLLVQKPMGLVNHKGGVRIVTGDPMYTCLTSWLSAPSGQATFNADACTQAAALP